ncbi:MAG: hypothetical protein KatS3mg075_162 [Meiothermus sp.]|jgi:hypothetical protein|nr:MAG: hypothetical protein KatS3mg075_162 [Meiothermus sp.]
MGWQNFASTLWLRWIIVVLILGLPACSGTPPDPRAREAIIPATTKVSDPSTRDALTLYDPETGILRFSTSTPLLDSLKIDNVLVSEPSSAAPYGYLRKIKAIRREGAQVVLETVQANLTDAIHQGWLEAADDLEASDLASAMALVEGLSVGVVQPTANVGDGFRFEARFDETVLDINEGDVRVKVRVNGVFYFNAGYNIAVGIKPRFGIPPAYVDHFEAWIGFEQRAQLQVSGEANAQVNKEKKVAEYRFKPLCFAIGPVPVCVVPTVYIFVGATGEVNLRFSYNAVQTAQAKMGARWTDSRGWEEIEPTPAFNTSFDQNFDINAGLKTRAYTKAEGALMLYGIAGPTIGAQMSIELDVAVPRDPFWILRGSLRAYYSFIVDIPVIGRVAEHSGTLYEIGREFGRSPAPPPTITIRTSPATVQLRVETDLAQFFRVAHPLGNVDLTVTSNLDGTLYSGSWSTDPNSLFGPELKRTFNTVGSRTLTLIARYVNSQTSSSLVLDVVNTPPTLNLQYGGDPRQGQIYPITVLITDPNEPDTTRLCGSTQWSVEAPDTLSATTGCSVSVTFGTTGARQIRVTARDSEGATTTRTLTLDVLPPPANPYPRITDYGVYSAEYTGGPIHCGSVRVASGSTINLSDRGCPTPHRYYGRITVENPNDEALTYDWKLHVSPPGFDNLLLSETASTSYIFELYNVHNSGLRTDDCRVTVKVNAPDPSRSKGPITVWTGRCTYYSFTLR